MDEWMNGGVGGKGETMWGDEDACLTGAGFHLLLIKFNQSTYENRLGNVSCRSRALDDWLFDHQLSHWRSGGKGVSGSARTLELWFGAHRKGGSGPDGGWLPSRRPGGGCQCG